MSISITWDIELLDVSPLDNIVKAAHWVVTARDSESGRTYEQRGRTELPAPGDSPKPYHDLNRDDVLAWVHSVIGEEFVGNWEQVVKDGIQTVLNAPVTQAAPWLTPVGEADA